MALSGRFVLVTLAALATAAATARLGLWQLDRAAQKTALAQAIAQRQALPPLAQAALARTPGERLAQEHRTVQVQGHWLPQHTVYLDNRQMQGRPGFYVLTPLLLAPGDAVLVQRGWAPRHLHERSRVPVLADTAEPVQLLARIAAAPSRLFEFEAQASGVLRQNLLLDTYARDIGVPLRPLALLQLASAQPQDASLQRQWPVPTTDVAKHHGYAFQWFALCALVTGLYVWFQLIQPTRRARAP